MKVYVISTGCIYEGGGVKNVFVNKEKAQEYFQQLVEEKRKSNSEMCEYSLNSDSEYTQNNAEKWLEEEHNITEDGLEQYVFYGGNFIAIDVWEAE